MNKRDRWMCLGWILFVTAVMIMIQWKTMTFQWNEFSELFAGDSEVRDKLLADIGNDIGGIWNRFFELYPFLGTVTLIAVPIMQRIDCVRVRKDRDFQQERRAELRAGYELLELSGEGDHVVGLAVKVHTQAKDALRRDTDALIADSGESGDHQGLVDAVKLANLGVDRIKAVMAEARAALDAPAKKHVGVVALKRLLSATQL